MCPGIHECPRAKTKKLSQLKTNLLSVHEPYTSICVDDSFPMELETDDLVEASIYP